jgi:hypothetical protein
VARLMNSRLVQWLIVLDFYPASPAMPRKSQSAEAIRSSANQIVIDASNSSGRWRFQCSQFRLKRRAAHNHQSYCFA